MDVSVVGRMVSTLPEDDDHPYRTGAWRPQTTEHDAVLDVVGDLPDDLDGVYLRNTENPLHPATSGRYHPFDGDGMLHSVSFSRGTATYRNRFVRTDGLARETAAGHALWAGIAEPTDVAVDEGWGARGRMKDASSTDVVVHAGRALTSFYQCGELYRLDPLTLDDLGKAPWVANFACAAGVSAHTKVDESTGELLFFGYDRHLPYLSYGVVDASDRLVHATPIDLPGLRQPHDMTFTEHYAVLNDCPLFWNPDLLAAGLHVPTYYPDLPMRLGVIPRRGTEVQWFEFAPTYVLHWTNAWEEGDEVVVEGFFEGNPSPTSAGPAGPRGSTWRFLAADVMETRLHQWRMNLRTGACSERDLTDTCSEFGIVNGRVLGHRNRYTYAATNEPGWFLFDGIVRHDTVTGSEDRYKLPPGVFGSEVGVAPVGQGEDDAYVITITVDVNADVSEVLVLDAKDIAAGPVARALLPERVSSGTHACWAPRSALVVH